VATAATLASLRAATRTPDTILVIDNQGDFSDRQATVVRPGANIGFARAIAQGAKLALDAGADWLWFVNNDARVDETCLEALLEAADERSRTGLLSPLILYGDGVDVWFAGGTVDARTLRTRHVQVAGAGSEPYATQYVTGCAMLARAAMVRECGPPDETLFMYYEDVEWSLRARARGWEAVVVPRAVVFHDVDRHGARRRFSPRAVYYLTRNRLLLARRSGSPVAALPSAVAWGLRQVVKAIAWRGSRATTRALVRGVRDGVRGRTGAMPSRHEGGLG
jgi:GT2 family glycosyltransferase